MENGSPDIARLQKIDQARRAWGRDIELVKNAQAGLFPRDLPLSAAIIMTFSPWAPAACASCLATSPARASAQRF
jgi:hypothetical protein